MAAKIIVLAIVLSVGCASHLEHEVGHYAPIVHYSAPAVSSSYLHQTHDSHYAAPIVYAAPAHNSYAHYDAAPAHYAAPWYHSEPAYHHVAAYDHHHHAPATSYSYVKQTHDASPIYHAHANPWGGYAKSYSYAGPAYGLGHHHSW